MIVSMGAMQSGAEVSRLGGELKLKLTLRLGPLCADLTDWEFVNGLGIEFVAKVDCLCCPN